MATTVAEIAAEVFRVGLFGRVLALAGLDSAEDATNRVFRGCLRSALRDGGINVPDPLIVADADVANLGGPSFEYVYLQTRIFLIDEILLNWDRVEKSDDADIEACKRMEDRLDLSRTRYRKRVDEMRNQSNGGGPAGILVGQIRAGRRLPRCP